MMMTATEKKRQQLLLEHNRARRLENAKLKAQNKLLMDTLQDWSSKVDRALRVVDGQEQSSDETSHG